jgi:uncharacterized caspase-like protein
MEAFMKALPRFSGVPALVALALLFTVPAAPQAAQAAVTQPGAAVTQPGAATTQPGAVSTRGLALVLGNAAYAKVKPLANPVNDARDIGAALKALGWEVISLTDASLPAMRQAVRDFGSRLDDRTPGLFYYAGHGIQVAGTNYLVPVDADLKLQAEVPESTLSVDFVLSVMDEKKAPLKMLILDACRDDPFRTSRSGGGGRGLAVLGKAATGTVIVYATAPNDVSQDGTGRNGVFTEAFLASLSTPGLEFRDIFDRTGEAVRTRTGGAQNPWMNSSYYGKLYLVSPAEAESQANARLESANAELAALLAQQDALARQLASASSGADKDRIATESKKASALEAAKREEAAVLEQMRQLAVARVAEESKNSAASAARADEAQAQLASLRDQVASRRASLSTSGDSSDMVKTNYFRLKSYVDSIADIQTRFADSLATGLAESEKARRSRVAVIEGYRMEAWESSRELAARKAEAQRIASGDYEREVAALRSRYAEASDRETGGLATALASLEASLVGQTWPLGGTKLKLTRGEFDRDNKTWVFTMRGSEPDFSAALTLRVAYKNTTELQKNFTALDSAWTAGAMEPRAAVGLRKGPSGDWEAYLATVSLVQVGNPETLLASSSPGAPAWTPKRRPGTVTVTGLPLVGSLAVAGSQRAVAQGGVTGELSFGPLPTEEAVELVWQVPEATSLDAPHTTILLAEGESRAVEARTGLLALPFIPRGSAVVLGRPGTTLFEAQKGEAGRTFALLPGTYELGLRGSVTGSWKVHIQEGTVTFPSGYKDTVRAQLVSQRSRLGKSLGSINATTNLGLASLGAGAIALASSGFSYWLGKQAIAEYRSATLTADIKASRSKSELYTTMMNGSLAVAVLCLYNGNKVLSSRPDSSALEASIKALDQGIKALGPK